MTDFINEDSVNSLECRHLNISTDGMCNDCFEWINNKKKKEKSISDLMTDLEYSDDIKRGANKVYRRLNIGNIKTKTQNEALLYCLAVAHVDLDYNKTVTIIGRELGMTQNKISSTINKYLKKDPEAKKRNPLAMTTNQMILSYCDKIGISLDSIDRIMEIYEYIMGIEYFYDLEQNDRKLFVTALVYAYLEDYGIEVGDREIREVFSTTLSNVNEIKEKILESVVEFDI